MEIYLLIAGMSVNAPLIVLIGSAAGLLAGIFGVGGGFLLTPLLIFIGIPPVVVVGTSACQLFGSSITGVIAHFRRRSVDLHLGLVLTAGGAAGTLAGIALFREIKAAGQVDVFIALMYVLLLGAVGLAMLVESILYLIARPRQTRRPRPPRLLHQLTWPRRFRRAGICVSILAPLAIGFLIGMLAAVMEVGGGFMMVPALIYGLGMATTLVAGTSLFQIIFVTGGATLLHASLNRGVDLLLAVLLILGSVIGTRLGAGLAHRLPRDRFRVLLAALVLAVCGKMAAELVIPPGEHFSLS